MPSPYEWSKTMNTIFTNLVVNPVRDDPRTDWSENLSLGYPFDVIRNQVLEKGLADFRSGHHHERHGMLSPDEKALLFCFVNLKKHFFACSATYEDHRTTLEPIFSAPGSVSIVDIGCGPGTACLALADFLPGRRIAYIGIELALPMHLKGSILLGEAKASGLLSPDSTIEFKLSWNEIALDQLPPKSSILMLCSYFFASHSLSVPAIRDFAHWVQSLTKTPAVETVLFVYVNSATPQANRNYEFFKTFLGIDPEATRPVELTIEFRKKPGGDVTRHEPFVQQVLRLKG